MFDYYTASIQAKFLQYIRFDCKNIKNEERKKSKLLDLPFLKFKFMRKVQIYEESSNNIYKNIRLLIRVPVSEL